MLLASAGNQLTLQVSGQNHEVNLQNAVKVQRTDEKHPADEISAVAEEEEQQRKNLVMILPL